jgi:hypothetical protein
MFSVSSAVAIPSSTIGALGEVVTFGAVADSDEFAEAAGLELAAIVDSGAAVSLAVEHPVSAMSARDAVAASAVILIIV